MVIVYSAGSSEVAVSAKELEETAIEAAADTGTETKDATKRATINAVESGLLII
tara:strand:- start:464 stop:625 length:162 start_codon:yes stop_codon:yes gene_type:complete